MFDANLYHSLGTVAVGYWRFADAGGTWTTTGDSSASGRNISLIPHVSPFYSSANTPTGSGYSMQISLGGPSQPNVLLLPSSNYLDFSSGVTMSAWVYLSSYTYTSDSSIIYLEQPNTTLAAALALSQNNFVCYDRAQAHSVAFGSVELNKWHHVACSINQSTGTMTTYFDGKMSGTPLSSGAVVGTPVNAVGITVGYDGPFSNTPQFTGLISNVGLFTAPLN